MKTLHIAGGGLAGLSIGIALRKAEVPVVVSEAARFPRHRVCGEFLSGVTPETLRALGIEDCLDDAQVLSTTTWYDRRGRIFSAVLPSPARGISRYRLDERLAVLFREVGGDFREGDRLPAAALEDEGVVLATGRAPEKDSVWLGLKAHLPGFETESDLEMHLGAEGYVGLSRVEGDRVNVAGLFKLRPGLKAKGPDALLAYTAACGLRSLAARMEAIPPDPESCLGVSSFGFGIKSRREGTGLRLGDRRAIIPPFTGNGMSMALESAELALPSLLSYASGRISWPECVHAYEEASGRYFARRVRAARLVHPFLFSRFGQGIAGGLARTGLLPFSLLYRAVR